MAGTSYQNLMARNNRRWNLDGVHNATETFRFARPRFLLGSKAIGADEVATRLDNGDKVLVSRELEVKYQDRVSLKRETSEEITSPGQLKTFAARFDRSDGPTEVYQVNSQSRTGWVDPSEYETANFYDGNADFVITPEEIVSEAAPRKLSYENDTLLDFQFHRLTKQIPPQVVEYLDSKGYQKAMLDLAGERPDLVKVLSIGKTREGRDIQVMRIGHGDNHAFISGLSHAREWLTGQVALETARELVNTPQLHDRLTAWIMPVHNSDGYEKSRTEDPSVRTNANGVDINRNYSAEWRLAGDSPHSTSDDKGGSDRLGSPSFRGKSALSEPESQAVERFLDEHSEITHWLDLHGYGKLMIMTDEQELAKNSPLIKALNTELPDYKVLDLNSYGATTGTSIQLAKKRGITSMVLELETSFQPGGAKRELGVQKGVRAAMTFLKQVTERSNRHLSTKPNL